MRQLKADVVDTFKFDFLSLPRREQVHNIHLREQVSNIEKYVRGVQKKLRTVVRALLEDHIFGPPEANQIILDCLGPFLANKILLAFFLGHPVLSKYMARSHNPLASVHYQKSVKKPDEVEWLNGLFRES